MIFKNENVIEDLIDIMLQLHNYVPTEHHTAVDESSSYKASHDVLHKILFGGDQLTRKRAEMANNSRKNSGTPTKKLDGLIPVWEDWHARIFWRY